jgi:hypothetical protein
MESETLKEQKEAFVSGWEGTHPAELFLICSTGPIGFWFFQAASTLLPSSTSPFDTALLEVVSIWIPTILCQTNLLYPFGFAYLLTQVTVSLAVSVVRVVQKGKNQTLKPSDAWRHTLTVYRASIMLQTCVAILAVDFQIFPRRLVKTEKTGYSLMDLGAASFVIAAGLVSPRARGREMRSSTEWRRLMPILLMGFLRLAAHKGIDYQEHASEYGAHWNFFFTLALLTPIKALIPGPSLLVPVAVLELYQVALTLYGLQEWIETAPRTCSDTAWFIGCHLWVANREGILGCLGYGSLFLLSECLAAMFVWSEARSNTLWWLGQMSAALVLLWRLLLLVAPVSRRSTNAVFCVWAVAVNWFELTFIYWVMATIAKERYTPPIMKTVNRHGLLVFIVANLLTGAVNVSVNTLKVQDGVALMILTAYMATVGLVAVVGDVILPRRRTVPKGANKAN